MYRLMCLLRSVIVITRSIMDNSERLQELMKTNERLEVEIARQDLEIEEWMRKIREEEVREAEERSGRETERDSGSGK